MAVRRPNRSAVQLDTLDAAEEAFFKSGGAEAPTGAAAQETTQAAETAKPAETQQAAETETTQPAETSATKAAAATTQAATTTTKPAATQAAEGAEKDGGNLSVALKQEREERKQLQREAADRDRIVNERLAKLAELVTPKPAAAEAPKVINPEEQPLEALQDVARGVQEFRDFKKQMGEARTQQQQAQAIMGKAAELETEFAKATPDYNDASNHLRTSRLQELLITGVPQHLAIQQVATETLQLAANALRQGRNPAEIVYQAAQVRGYQKKAAQAAAQTNGAEAQTNGGTQTQQAGETEEQKIARINRAQEAGRSLGQTQGAAPAKVTGQSLADMSSEAFAEFYAKVQKDPARMREFFGA